MGTSFLQASVHSAGSANYDARGKSKHQSYQAVNYASYNNTWPDKTGPLAMNSYECYGSNQQLSGWIKDLLCEMEPIADTN